MKDKDKELNGFEVANSFKVLLKEFDPYYEFSDDHKYWQKQNALYKVLSARYQELKEEYKDDSFMLDTLYKIWVEGTSTSSSV